MEENEEFDSDFNPEDIPISEEFWNYMEHYWHNNREFPESTEASLNKKADLVDGKVPSSQLPSYIDDVLEYDTFESLPNSGEKGKIYVITNNNTQFRWSGSEYIQLNSDENIVMTDTNQDIIGRKSFITAGGNGYNNNSLRLLSNDGSNPGLTFYKGGVDIANMYFDGKGNFKFRNADDTVSRYVFANGFKKDGSDDNYFLTAGGGHVLRSTIPTSTQADAKYIPYFGATANINLNAKPIANAGNIDATIFRNVHSSVLVKSFSLHSATTVTSLGIKLTNAGTSIMMGSFTVTMFGYVGQTMSFRVSMYKYNNTWHVTTITWLHGDSSKISNIEFYKENDSNLHLKVNFTTNFGAYNKTVITDVLANGQSEALHNPDTYTISVNPDNSTHTLVQTTSSISFIRDNVGAAPKAPISLGTSDLNTIQTPGFYNQITDANATIARNYPVTLAGTLNVYRSITNGVIQEYTSHVGITYKRYYNGSAWASSWAQIIDSRNGGVVSGALTINGNLNVANNSTVLGSTIQQNTVPASGSAVTTHNNVMTNSTQLYGLAFGSLGTGVQYIQATRFDGTATNYELRLNPNGGTVSFGGAINSSLSELLIQRQGVNKIRTGGTNGDSLILSSTSAIYLRPQGDAINTGEVLINSSGNIITTSYGNASQWNNVSQAFIANPFFSRNSLISQNVTNAGVTTLDSYLPNGGYISNYGVTNWGGTDAPTGASYGGFIKFGDTSGAGNNGLQLYYNNGHGGADSHRLWFRTKNSTVGTTNWFEVATVQSLNGYVRTTGDQNIDGIKGFTGSYTQWILNGDGSNARGFISSTASTFTIGTLNDKNISFSRNGVSKLTLGNNFSDFADYVRSPGFIKNGSSGSFVLLGDGNDKPLSDFATTAQLTGYAKLADNQTFTGVNTFSQSPIVPDPTLVYHAVSYGFMDNAIIESENNTANWVINSFIPNTHVVNGITSANITNWNNAFNFTSNFTTNYNDLVAIEALSGTNGYLRKDGNGQWSLVSSPVVDATATIAGKVKLGSDTIQTVASNFVTATIGKTYSVQVNSSGQLVVNVGWSDTNTTYTGNNGITLTGTNFTPTYGTSANTVAQGNDSRINNGQTAFGWGNHATAGYTSQAWVQSQNYATSNFVEERIDKLTGEIIDPTPSFSIKNEFTTVILTENFSKEPLELEGELIPEQYISIINLTGSKVELTRDHNPIDIIYENETSEYYITKERRLVKKGTYKSAKILI
ncbi:hypothetical protein [Chryseobacterium scophthalmum]|uniref:hypothetical protein n=1 Tax=Chryseobacterium scophthalmum TaxID=59733 RepID=UPI003D038190